jgi:hypothetical protein
VTGTGKALAARGHSHSGPALVKRLGIASGLAAAGFAGFVRLYRPWHLRWGATDEEVLRELPGDGVVVGPTFNATRAITVDAPPQAVWPWIAQMGFGRAGWYSYDLLDNLGRHSADTIIPSLQDVRIGDLVPMGPGGGGLRVKELVPGEWLLWWDGVGHSTWLWNLEQVAPGQTRLITRVRMRYRWTHPSILFALLLMEPWDFPMMRKCMLGIKRRVESASPQAGPSPQSSRSKRPAGNRHERRPTRCWSS